MNPKDLRYSKEHEWVRVEGDEAVIGITDFAQEQLGDVVYVELLAVGPTQFKSAWSSRSRLPRTCFAPSAARWSQSIRNSPQAPEN